MHAGEVLAVGAVVLVIDAVFLGGAGGIGELLGGGGEHPGATTALTGRVGDFAADAEEEAVAADFTLRHDVIAGDDLVDLVGGRAAVVFVEVFIFLPEGRISRLAVLDKLGAFPLRDLAAGLDGIPHEERWICAECGGANVAPAAITAFEFDRVVAHGGSRLQVGGERADRHQIFQIEAGFADLIDI